MAKAPRKSYDLAEVIASELAKAQPVDVIAGDRTFHIPPPVLWPDKVYEVGDIEGARILLGDDYEAYCAAGGTAKLLSVIIAKSVGATVPESPASTD